MITTNSKNIGERIRVARENKGLTKQQLGDLIGKNRTTILRYENGFIDNLPYTILIPLAKSLDVSIDYLLGIEKNPTDNNIVDILNKLHELVLNNDKNKLSLIEKGKSVANYLNELEKKGYSKEEVNKIANEYNVVFAPKYRELMLLYEEIKSVYNEMKNAVEMYGDEVFKDLSTSEIEELKNYVRFIKLKRKD